MNVLCFQIDGKLPNLALMRLSAWHREHGDNVILLNSFGDLSFIPTPDRVYASSIFTSSHERRAELSRRFSGVVSGGDGYHAIWNDLTVIGKNLGSNLREVIQDRDPETIPPDYSHYSNFTASIGYTQRGCRLDCGFCRMKTREGDARSVRTLNQIWRGAGFPRHVCLLDNDFFGQGEWESVLREAIEGQFKVCFNQGINIRLITYEQARVLAQVYYCDDSFKTRRLYTAWDNLGDEKRFKAGVAELKEAGISPSHLMVYMLLGFRKGETEEEILYRFNEMVKLGCRPYPMVFDNKDKNLKKFQRWVIRRYYELVPWEEFKRGETVQGENLPQEVFQF